MDGHGEASSGRPQVLADERRASLAPFVVRDAVVVILAIPAMLAVAFAIAAAAR